MGREIVANELTHGLAGLHRAAGVVRLQHDIGKLQEALVDRWLVPEHVEPGTLYGAGFQGREQRGLVDRAAARNVYDDTVCSERCQDRRVDDVFRALAAGE